MEELADGVFKQVKSIVVLRNEMVNVVEELMSSDYATPIEFSVMGFIEIFDAVLSSEMDTQMEIIKGIRKFLELLPEDEKGGRKLAIGMISDYIEFMDKKLGVEGD